MARVLPLNAWRKTAGRPTPTHRGPHSMIRLEFGCFNDNLLNEADDGGCPDGSVLVRECEASRLYVAVETGNGVAALIAGVKEVAAWVNRETARVIAACPF